MTHPHRCKCGDFSALPVCPKCRAKREKEDRVVRFLIGDVVVKPTVDLASARLQAARYAGCYEG
jgi:hypothetical protein